MKPEPKHSVRLKDASFRSLPRKHYGEAATQTDRLIKMRASFEVAGNSVRCLLRDSPSITDWRRLTALNRMLTSSSVYCSRILLHHRLHFSIINNSSIYITASATTTTYIYIYIYPFALYHPTGACRCFQGHLRPPKATRSLLSLRSGRAKQRPRSDLNNAPSESKM